MDIRPSTLTESAQHHIDRARTVSNSWTPNALMCFGRALDCLDDGKPLEALWEATRILEYRVGKAGAWTALATFVIARAEPQTLRTPLPPGDATELRWRGPCPNNSALQCTL